MRYINIALLCVQNDATDRPTTQYLVAMLGHEETSLPKPKHLAFFDVKVTDEEPCSVNDAECQIYMVDNMYYSISSVFLL
jgi:hypothetical protein